ncbi:chitinase 1 [Pilobolus umbonatus]|nr:chitinase 1 [Pilobolus umbonatus]
MLCVLATSLLVLLSSLGVQSAYQPDKPNVLYYWGQNSAGSSTSQQRLSYYCNSGLADIILLSFLNTFNINGLPGINLSNACEGTVFPGSQLLSCPDIGKDIELCQAKGVKILLSLGGAAGAYGFNSDSDAVTFANTIWDLFGGGSSATRPFGDAVIDGVDLDIEGGSTTGYVAFVRTLRSKSNFLISAAPQCPFPDVILGSTINAIGFDFINVQFYNNYCSLVGSSFNFDTWDAWARNTSPNKNVKILLTIPGSSTAASTGFAPISNIVSVAPLLASKYSSYGGVAVWDASQTWNNGDFASSLYSVVKGSGNVNQPLPSPTTSALATIPQGSTFVITSPSVNPSPGGIIQGQPCSSSGGYACAPKGQFGICDNGKWVVQSCYIGTVCIPTADGVSIYCGYSSSLPNIGSSLNIHPLGGKGSIPRPYSTSNVATQIVVLSASSGKFKILISARRTQITPFSQHTTVEFTTESNIRFSSSDHGTVRQVGNSVRIQVNNPSNESMAILLEAQGTIQSGIFVAPRPASLRFK